MPWTCSDCGTVKATRLKKNREESWPRGWERIGNELLCYACSEKRYKKRFEQYRQKAEQRERERGEREQRERGERERWWSDRQKHWQEQQRAFDDYLRSIKELDNRINSRKRTQESALRVLGLSRPFTLADLQRAYRRLALARHPDRGGSPDSFREATEARDVALEMLSD